MTDYLNLQSGSPDVLSLQQGTLDLLLLGAESTVFTYSLDSQSFWRISFPSSSFDIASIMDYDPFASSTRGDLLIGSNDGYLRQFDRTAYRDDGNDIESFVIIGPLKMAEIGEGIVQQLESVLDNASGDVTWELYVGNSSMDAVDTTKAPVATGTWGPGLNYTSRPRARGMAYCLKIKNAETNDGWSLETVSAVETEGGRRRK